MGQCTSSQKRPSQKPYTFQCQPAGTQELKDKALPKLLFHSSLANVNLKQYPYKKATVHFRMQAGEFITLPTKNCSDQNNIMWRIFESFDFQMTEYQLRKHFLDVVILNQLQQKVGEIKINLFFITTGPFHQDFAIHFVNDKVGRISFDLKISQIIDLKIESEGAQISLNKKHPGEEFCYSIKTIDGFSSCSVESECSYPAMVLLDNKQLKNEDRTDIQELTFVRRKSIREQTKQIREGGELKWTKDGQSLPVIQVKVVASELHNTYFQILVWKYHSELQTTRELFVDTYVSFYKLLGKEPTTFMEGGIEYEERSIVMTEKVEHKGKDYGTGNFRFKIVNPSYFKQYQLCIYTEVGILKTNPIFGVSEVANSGQCPELKSILEISSSLEHNFITLNKLQSEEGSREEIRRQRELIQNELIDIYNFLQKTSHSPLYLYTYSEQKDLLRGQKILVQLGMKVTQFIENQDPIAKDLCFLILISLIKRGEFNLSHMGFNDQQKKQILSNKFDSFLLLKQEIGIMYKLLLNKLLNHALNSINHKGSDYQRTFAEVICAYAYFRIPQFRKEILRLVTKETDPEIIEWRGVDFNLHEDIGESRMKDKGNTFREMFDWQHHFYKYLRKNDQIENNCISIKQILEEEHWKERFIKRGLAFFYFLKYWVTYIDNTLPNYQDVEWAYFPGYNRLLRGFFVQLKLRPILDYPDALIEAALKLLANEKILNPMMKILINKVNVYDTSAVMRFLQYLGLMLQAVNNLKHRLSISFNYSIFFKALSLIFEGDVAIAVSAALTLIYNHFELFHVQFRRNISMYFLGAAFNKFFLHWSYNVRYVFYHLLTFKVYRQALQDEGISSFRHNFAIQNGDIVKRYQDLMKLLSVEVSSYKRNKKASLHPALDKHLFRKMKIKLVDKFKKETGEYTRVFNEISYNKSEEEHSEKNRDFVIETEIKKKDRSVSDFGETVLMNRGNKLQRKKSDSTIQKKQEIKRNLKANEFYYNHPSVGKKTSLFYDIIPSSELQIKDIDTSKLKLVQICLAEFKNIEKQFLDGIAKGISEVPEIKQQISIDKREIRPKEFDDW